MISFLVRAFAGQGKGGGELFAVHRLGRPSLSGFGGCPDDCKSLSSDGCRVGGGCVHQRLATVSDLFGVFLRSCRRLVCAP